MAAVALKLDQNSGTEPLAQIPSNRIIGFFNPAAYAQYNQNVFKMHSFKAPAEALASSLIKTTHVSQEFEIRSGVTFDKAYDFTKNEFPFRPFAPTTFFRFSPVCCNNSYQSQYGNQGNTWPQINYAVFFNNSNIVDGLKLPQKQAEQFLNSRTQNGFVNTQMNSIVLFHIVGFRKANGVNVNQGQFVAHIDKFILLHQDGKPFKTYSGSTP